MRSQSVVTLCPLQHPHSEHTVMFQNDWLLFASVNVPECTYFQDTAQEAWPRTWHVNNQLGSIPSVFSDCHRGIPGGNQRWLLLIAVIILRGCQVGSLTLPFIRYELGSGCKTLSCVRKVQEVLWTSGKLWRKRVNMRTSRLILISFICYWHWL